MTNEEFNRKMEFLLNQQAKFDADMLELKEAHKQTDKRFAQTEEQIGHLAGLVHEGFGLTLSLFNKTDAKIQELAESQKLTDQQLRKLAAKLDRHISEGHSGLGN